MNRTLTVVAVGLALFGTGCVTKALYFREVDRAKALEAELAQAKKDLDAARQKEVSMEEKVQALQEERNRVEETLSKEIKEGKVKLSQIAGKLQINMVDKILFPSGSSELSDEGETVLRQVARALSRVHDKQIWISGHTDNVRISPSLRSKFATNWELSAARAISVVRFLHEKGSLSGDRLIAVGQGQFHPVATNKTADGREQNRRIEILLVPAPRALSALTK